MKRSKIEFPVKVFLPFIAGCFFIASCNNNDTNPTSVKYGTDSAMIAKADSMAPDQTHVGQMDTAHTGPVLQADSSTAMKTDTTSKSNMAKKGKKGKVSIAPAEMKANTATMEMDKEGFYSNTEILPSYPGGQKALERFFEDNIQYPEAAADNQVEGTVRLTFNVDESGKIYQPVAAGNKLGYGLEEEAIRVFNKMPKWTPGKIKGKNVKTRFTLPVKFQLG